jgi:anthranilate synthase component 1
MRIPMKVSPSESEFRELSSKLARPCIVPVMAELSEQKLGPAEAYLTLSRNQHTSFLLESAESGGKTARYSFIGTDPLVTLEVKDKEIEVRGDGELKEMVESGAREVKKGEDSVDIIKKAFLFGRISVPEVRQPRFICGPVGYFSYDIVRSMVQIGEKVIDDLKHPDAEFMLGRNTVVFDHEAKKSFICSNALIFETSDPEEVYASSLREIETKAKQLEKVSPLPRLPMSIEPSVEIRSGMSKPEFTGAVEKAKAYIDRGDLLQIVLSRRMETDLKCDPYFVYLALREMNPSPYMYYLDFGPRKILGSSPETLVRVEEGKVMTRPIGGTRRRGRDAKEDVEIERKLLSDRKEREEHMMLVHLGREDISKVAEVGSVKVEDFMIIERYSHVMHIVSTVSGLLREGKDEFDALKANFPAGTVVGAPRLRAMEIIEELEPSRRGIYAGGVGYFDYRRNMDFAITIRTVTAEGGKAHVQVGAGVVSRSVPGLEFYETENKGRALVKAIGIAEASSGE